MLVRILLLFVGLITAVFAEFFAIHIITMHFQLITGIYGLVTAGMIALLVPIIKFSATNSSPI